MKPKNGSAALAAPELAPEAPNPAPDAAATPAPDTKTPAAHFAARKVPEWQRAAYQSYWDHPADYVLTEDALRAELKQALDAPSTEESPGAQRRRVLHEERLRAGGESWP